MKYALLLSFFFCVASCAPGAKRPTTPESADVGKKIDGVYYVTKQHAARVADALLPRQIRTPAETVLLAAGSPAASLDEAVLNDIYTQAKSGASYRFCGGKLPAFKGKGVDKRRAYVKTARYIRKTLKKEHPDISQCLVVSFSGAGLQKDKNGINTIPKEALPSVIFPPGRKTLSRYIRASVFRTGIAAIMLGKDIEALRDIAAIASTESAGKAFSLGRDAGLYLHCGGSWKDTVIQKPVAGLKYTTNQRFQPLFNRMLYAETAIRSARIYKRLLGECVLR